MSHDRAAHQEVGYQRRRFQKRNDNDDQSRARIGRDRAAAIARSATGGRVLGVRLKGDRYFVKVLLEGERVRVVRVDAYTGQMR